MYQVFNLQTPPDKLIQYLQTSFDRTGIGFRRRAVLARSFENNWLLVCCTVEAFPNSKQAPEVAATRRYLRAILYEDWLNPEECRKFIDDVQKGEVTIGDVQIERKGIATWRMELLPLKNSYMTRAGWMSSSRFDWASGRPVQDPLLARGEPYYPDLNEAARDWLPLTTYHGESDARNYEVIFLLPEARAFFTDAEFHDGILEVTIEGAEFEALRLVVKGAYWMGASIEHFEGDVKAGKARFRIPDDVDRLEYVLMDSNGLVYDFQREDRFNHSGLGRKRRHSIAQDLVQSVRTACLEGEGMQIEFKPFIDCEQGMGTKSKKTKLRELVTTIVAFANTNGGRVYIGVDDECGLAGIKPELEQWAQAKVSDDALNRYRGMLTSKIRDQLIGDVSLSVSYTFVDDAAVIVVDVSQSAAKPVAVRGDNLFYVRAGASNMQVPPNHWESVLGQKTTEGVFPHAAS